MKEAGIIEFQWALTVNNEADMFTKNLARPEYNKHAARLCGHNQDTGTAQEGVKSHRKLTTRKEQAAGVKT